MTLFGSDHCSNTSLRNSKHHGFWANIQVNTKNLAECNILPQPASSCNKKIPSCKLPDAEKTCLLPHCFGSNLLAERGTSRPGTSTSKRRHNWRSSVRRRQRTCRQGRWPRGRGRRWGQQHKDDVKFLICQLQHTKKKTLWIASLSWRLILVRHFAFALSSDCSDKNRRALVLGLCTYASQAANDMYRLPKVLARFTCIDDPEKFLWNTVT